MKSMLTFAVSVLIAAFAQCAEHRLDYRHTGGVPVGVAGLNDNARTGRESVYACSSSTVLLPTASPAADGSFPAEVFVHFPPKVKRFEQGYTRRISLRRATDHFEVNDKQQGEQR